MRRFGGSFTSVVITLVMVLLLIFRMPIFMFFSYSFERMSTKWEMDNPYVDRRFFGWKKVSLEGGTVFRIPEDWGLEVSDEIISVTDDEGKLWAIGTVYDKDVCYLEFLTAFVSADIIDYEMEIPPEFIVMEKAEIDVVTVNCSGMLNRYGYLELRESVDHWVFFWILEDIQEDSEQYDIVEAIAYSFVY